MEPVKCDHANCTKHMKAPKFWSFGFAKPKKDEALGAGLIAQESEFETDQSFEIDILDDNNMMTDFNLQMNKMTAFEWQDDQAFNTAANAFDLLSAKLDLSLPGK